MTTDRMTDEVFNARMDSTQQMNGWSGMYQEAVTEAERARRVEQEQSEKIRQLEDMLRLANDKMAEQVRQARWEVADDALAIGGTGRETFLRGVRDANAPKD